MPWAFAYGFQGMDDSWLMTVWDFGVQSGFPEVITLFPDSAMYSKKRRDAG